MIPHGADRFAMPARALLAIGAVSMLLTACTVPAGPPSPASGPRASERPSPLGASAASPDPAIADRAGGGSNAAGLAMEGATLPLPEVQVDPLETPPDTGWRTIGRGMEHRYVDVWDPSGRILDRLWIVRVHPDAWRFDIGYRPDAPLLLTEWLQQTDATLAVNGGFFTEDGHATGLVVVDGEPSGVGYGDFAGMVAIDTAGRPRVRWLRAHPYAPDDAVVQGLQSFPMLVQPGGRLGFPQDDGARSRRTVIAEDVQGRILLVVAPSGSMTLHGLARWLVGSDLGVDVALNLDGGSSTGMIVEDLGLHVPALTRLPIVITARPRDVTGDSGTAASDP